MKRLLTLQGETEAVWQKPDPDYLGPGANNTLLATQLGAPVWTDTATIENFSVSGAFGSTDEATFNNVDFLGPIAIGSIASVANQYIGTDTLNQLGWQDLPVTPLTAVFELVAFQDLNLGVYNLLQWYPASFDSLSGYITKTSAEEWTINTSGVYKLEVYASVGPTASAIYIDIEKNGGTILARSELGVNETNSAHFGISALAPGETVRVTTTRFGANTTAKIILSLRSFLCITKIG